jgi:hypothetical protein
VFPVMYELNYYILCMKQLFGAHSGVCVCVSVSRGGVTSSNQTPLQVEEDAAFKNT